MFHHVKELEFNARVSGPDPRFASLLLEQFGGANSELKAAMQYFTQAFAARKPYPDKYDMLMDIATEELSHLEIVGATITMLLDGVTGELKNAADSNMLTNLLSGNMEKELYRYNTVLRAEFSFVNALNSHACQVAVERAYSAIARFYSNCKKSMSGKKGYPKFKKNCRSVEYKTSGWKLSEDRRSINFIDKKGIGKLKLKGTWDLHYYQLDQIKRVRLVCRADGYYVQFLVSAENKVDVELTGNMVGLDVGISEFYTDSNGHTEPNPKFYRTGEKRLKFRQRRVSRKKKGSANRKRAINKLGRVHLKISRQREEHAKRVARCVIQSNDLVAYEDLRIKNLVKNHCLAKSINDAGWYQFRKWLEHFGEKFGKITVAVNPAYTSQECSNCGTHVKKSLSTRTHVCKCGFVLDRDWNAAINILKSALSTTGHVGTWVINPNASGDLASTLVGAILSGQVGSMNEESPHF